MRKQAMWIPGRKAFLAEGLACGNVPKELQRQQREQCGHSRVREGEEARTHNWGPNGKGLHRPW